VKTDLDVMNKLRDVIANQLNSCLEEGVDEIKDKGVIIDFPDTDQMPDKNCIYIQPNDASIEDLTTGSDYQTSSFSLFIVCKRDKKENITKKIFKYFEGLYALLRGNMTLDSYVDFTSITGYTYYPMLEASSNCSGMEISVELQYARDF